MKVRGVRGAITVEQNDAQQILSATEECFLQMMKKNNVDAEDLAAVYITTTRDLDAVFPAQAIRKLAEWELVPLMCGSEIDVSGSLSQCIRLLAIINTEKSQASIEHVFLRGAVVLRPDLVR